MPIKAISCTNLVMDIDRLTYKLLGDHSGTQDMELVEGHTSTRSFKHFGHVTDGTIRLRAWSKAETYCLTRSLKHGVSTYSHVRGDNTLEVWKSASSARRWSKSKLKMKI